MEQGGEYVARWGQEGRAVRRILLRDSFSRPTISSLPLGGFIRPFDRPPGPVEKSLLMTIPGTPKTRSGHYGREYHPFFFAPSARLTPLTSFHPPLSIRNSESLVGLKM